MISYQFPTIDKHNNQVLMDGFTDVGGAPLPADILWQWISEAVLDHGTEILRKPQMQYDETRDVLYPRYLGGYLGLGQDVRVFYSNSGTEAIEVAMKVARKATGLLSIYGIAGDFHGRSFGVQGIQQAPKHHTVGFGPQSIPYTYCLEPDAELTGNGAAAIIISPINGNNRVEHWPDSVWDMALKVRKAGGLIIFDEVQTGFGRAGGIVSIQNGPHAVPVDPDIWVFGKAAAAGWPMSMTVTRAGLIDGLMTTGTHFNTMAGAPIGMHLSSRLIHTLDNCGLLDDMESRASRLASLFPDMERVGYMMSLSPSDPIAFAEYARALGLALLAPHPDVPIRLSPPFIMQSEEEKWLERTLASSYLKVAREQGKRL